MIDREQLADRLVEYTQELGVVSIDARATENRHSRPIALSFQGLIFAGLPGRWLHEDRELLLNSRIPALLYSITSEPGKRFRVWPPNFQA